MKISMMSFNIKLKEVIMLQSRYIKLFSFFILLCLSSQVLAMAQKKLSWMVGDKNIELIYEQGIWASAFCFEKSGCQALSMETKSRLAKIKGHSGPGGKNPGSEICHQLPKTQLVIGTHPKTHNQQSLCIFEDQSVIATSSL